MDVNNPFIQKIEIESAKVLTEPLYNRVRVHIFDVSLDNLIQGIGAEKIARAIGVQTCVAAHGGFGKVVDTFGKEAALKHLNITEISTGVCLSNNGTDSGGM